MPAAEVSVVVPCHAAASTIGGLLSALRRQTLGADRFEVLIVDPGADGTRRVLEREAADWTGPPLRLVRGPLHGGPAAKRNVGARAARGEVLAFTDADCLPEPAWLAAGLARGRAGAEIVQGPTLPPGEQVADRFSHTVAITRETGLYETCNVFYQRALFERLGGFTTRYFRRFGTPFGEDAELAWRARRAGARTAFEPAAVVRHPVGPLGLRGHLSERALVRGFPALVRDVPELREALLYRRRFLSRRSARFLAAVLGAALLSRRPAAGLLILPYADELGAAMPPRSSGAAARARYLGLTLLSDTATAGALLYGSARARTLVL